MSLNKFVTRISYSTGFSWALVLLFLSVFSLPGAGQTPTAFKLVGTSNSTSLFGSATAKKTQLLYPTGVLTGAASGNIGSIYFRYNATGATTTLTDLVIKIGQTSNSTFSPSTTFYTGLTTVLTAPTYTIQPGVAGDWFQIPLSTPFSNYDPSQTLIVEVSWTTSSNASFSTLTSSFAGRKLITPTITNTTGTTSSFWQDFGITIATAGGQDLSFTNISAGSNGCLTTSEPVTVTITNNGASPFNFATTPATINLNVTGPNPFTFPPFIINSGTLAPFASTTVTIFPNYNMEGFGTYTFNGTVSTTGDINAANNSLNGITVINQSPGSLPQAVDFTGFNGNNLTAQFPGWYETTSAAGSNGTTSNWTNSTGLGGSTNTTARINLASNSKRDWIVSPKILANSTTGFRFKAAVTDYNSLNPDANGMDTDDKVQVMVSTDCGATFVPIYTIDASSNLTNNLSDQFVSLAPYSGQYIILAVFATEGTASGASFYDFHIDDLFIGTVSPTDLGVTSLNSPFAGSGCFGASENVVVTVKNLGVGPFNFSANNTRVTVDVTGTITQTLQVTLSDNSLNGGTPLPVGASIQVPVGVINMSLLGNYTFNSNTTLITGGPDAISSNDAMTPVTITVTPPAAGTATASVASLCKSGTAILNLTGSAGGNIQWQQANSASGLFTNIAGATTTSYTLATPISQTTYFQALVTCGINNTVSNVVTIAVDNPQATASTGDTRCGSGPVNLSATPSSGTSIYWFASATEGAPLANGNVYSPVVTTTTTFYAEATTGTNESAGKAFTTVSAGKATIGGLYFNAASPFLLRTVDIYTDLNAGGNLVVNLRDASNAILLSQPFTIPTGSGFRKVTVPLNFNVPAGTGFLLEQATILNLYRDLNSNSFPYNSTNNTVTITNGTTNGAYFFFYNWVISTGCAGSRIPVTATVNQVPVVNLGPDIIQCGNASVLDAGNAGGTYQWLLNGTPISGATSQTYTPTSSGNYEVSVIRSGCTGSDAVMVTINPKPSNILVNASGPTTICQGESVVLTGTSTSTGITYKWSRNGTLITGANSAAYTASQSGNYRVIISTAAGCSDSSAITAITVNPKPAKPTITVSGSTTFCQGESVTLTGATSTTGITYKWLLNGAPINGSTTNTIPATQSGDYRIVVFTSSGCSDTSAITTITVKPKPNKPVVTANGDTTFCVGGSVTLTGSTTTAGVSYSWSRNGQPIIGANTASLIANLPGLYRVIVNSSGCSDSSNTKTITVNPQPIKPVINIAGSAALCMGESVDLFAASTTTGVTYKWSLNGTLINGATSDTYTATQGGDYRVIITTAAGCTDSSSITAITVSPLPVKPTLTVNGNIPFCEGDHVVLTGASATAGVQYTWSRNGARIANANASTYQAMLPGNYRVIVTSAAGCSDSSAIETITVISKPARPAISVNITLTEGLLTASPSTGTYQWYVVSTDGSLFTIPGATAQTFTPSMAGTYSVKVTEDCESEAATPVTISDITKPEMKLDLHPNPTSGKFTIDMIGFVDDQASIEVINSVGQLIRTENVLVSSHIKTSKDMDISGIGSGIYFIKVVSGVNTIVKRISIY